MHFVEQKYKLINNKNETESQKITHTVFRETNLVLWLLLEWQIKSETVMSWTSRKKMEGIFTVYFVRRILF